MSFQSTPINPDIAYVKSNPAISQLTQHLARDPVKAYQYFSFIEYQLPDIRLRPIEDYGAFNYHYIGQKSYCESKNEILWQIE